MGWGISDIAKTVGTGGLSLAVDGGLWDDVTGQSAADDAAKAQQKATDASLALQRESRDIAREDQAPFRDAGVNAIPGLEKSISQGQRINTGQRQFQKLNNFAKPMNQALFLANDPVMNYAAKEAGRTIGAQTAATGKLGSGEQYRVLQNTLGDMAQSRLNDRRGELTNLIGQQSNIFSQNFNKNNMNTNSLFNLVTMGQNAAANQGAATQNATNNMTNLLTNQGNANAAAATAGYNNIMGLVNSGIGAAGTYYGAKAGG